MGRWTQKSRPPKKCTVPWRSSVLWGLTTDPAIPAAVALWLGTFPVRRGFIPWRAGRPHLPAVIAFRTSPHFSRLRVLHGQLGRHGRLTPRCRQPLHPPWGRARGFRQRRNGGRARERTPSVAIFSLHFFDWIFGPSTELRREACRWGTCKGNSRATLARF